MIGFIVWAKSDSAMSAVADHPGLSLRGKKQNTKECPNEEMNKKTKTNVHIGTLVFVLFGHYLMFCYFLVDQCDFSPHFITNIVKKIL